MKLLLLLLMTYSTICFSGNHPWPFIPKEIGHSFASFQLYSTGSLPYFHRGLDIIGRPKEMVYSSTAGTVIRAWQYGWDEDYFEVVIRDDAGNVWKYHHIDEYSVPSEVFEAVRSGKRVEEGIPLGRIVNWMIRPYGKDFHHLHLEIEDIDGNYVNPFLLLEPLVDSDIPEIEEIGILKYGRPSKSNSASGKYGLYVKTRDLILSDLFYVPPYSIEYSLDGAPFITVWTFDAVPGGNDKRKDAHKLFVPDSTCGDYRCREFYINLGYPGRTFPATRGNHNINVRVRDFAGNIAYQTFSYTVQ